MYEPPRSRMSLAMQARIDAMSREELASEWCRATLDSLLFRGELGEYFCARLRETDAVALALSVGFRFSDAYVP
jgi:hypothetical protein